MKKTMIVLMLLMIPLVSAIGVIEYGNDIKVETFLNMINGQRISDVMNVQWDSWYVRNGNLNINYTYTTIDGDYDDGFYIVRVVDETSLPMELIRYCLNNYNMNTCRNYLLVRDEPLYVNENYTIYPILYQRNMNIDYQIQRILAIQEEFLDIQEANEFMEEF